MEQSNHSKSTEHSASVFSVTISGENRAQVAAPVIAYNTFAGDFTYVNNFHGTNKPPIEPQEPDQCSITHNYEDIIQRNEFVKEYNTTLGENLLLEEQYTDLLIIQKQRERSEREKEICSKGEIFQELLRSREYEEKYRSTSVDQFFSPEDDGKIPKAVVLQGNSGNGKSFTAQWIMLRWAQRKLYVENFDFIFHLQCKEINGISDSVTLVELLQHNQSLKPEQILWILQHASKRVLFLIDGFDELKPLKDNASIASLQTSALPEDILCALLSGRLLPGSFLLITTRSMAADRLSKLLKHPQRFTEIMGFSEEGVEKYFEKFFKDKQLSHTQAYERVKTNETLYTACSIPVICWIVCTVLNDPEEEKDEDEDEDGDIKRELETTTSIYVVFMLTLLEHHGQGLDDSVCSVLRSLGQLAEKGTKGKQVLFDKKSVPKEISDPANIPFLCKFLLKRVRLVTMFSFVHLSFQEFFAALHYTFLEKEESQKEVGKMLDSLGIHQDQHLLPVIQFLFGLSNEDISNTFMETYDLSSFTCVRTLLEEWVLKAVRGRGKSHERMRTELFILQCLYELHDRDFVKKAMDTWRTIVFHSNPLRRTDCWVLQYCLQCCPRIKSLSLMGCFITADKLRMLQPALRKCDELSLMVEDLSDNDVKDLILCLGEETDLRDLRVWDSPLSGQSLQQILGAVSKQKSVGRLELSVKRITTDAAVLLTDFMTNKELKMFVLTDQDVKSLYSSVGISRKDGDIILSVGHSRCPQPKPSLSEMSLVCSHSHMSHVDWTNIFQTFHGVRSVTELCPEFDERLDALLSSLDSVTGLKKLELRVSSLTDSWATGMLALIQNSSSLVYICLEETKGGPSDDEALYSSLAMLTKDGHFTLCVGDDIRTYKSLKSQSPQTKPPLSEICLTCSHSEISRVNWKNFFQTYNEIKSFSEECGEFDDRCDALLSFLDSVPVLKEVDLKVIRVTENWATRMLSLMQTCPSLQHIGVVTDAELPKRDSVEECLCVSLSMSNRNGDFTLSIEGRGWIRSVFMGFSSAKSLSPQTKSSLSRISLTCPHSQISTIRWTGFLRTFNKVNGLTESCEKFDEQFNALLSFLNSVPGLKKVDLNVNILSKSWATRTLDLIQTCPSLQDIRLAAGFGGKGLLLEEGIKLLQESEKGPDCTLTLDGWRCTKPSDQCTGEEDWNLYCNQRVKLQICGQTCTEECLT